MDLRQRSSVERWGREIGGTRSRRVGWRRFCPPEFLVLGCVGLMSWLALVTWTGTADRSASACASLACVLKKDRVS